MFDSQMRLRRSFLLDCWVFVVAAEAEASEDRTNATGNQGPDVPLLMNTLVDIALDGSQIALRIVDQIQVDITKWSTSTKNDVRWER